MDPIAVLAAILGFVGTYISYRTYRRSSALARLVVELDAYREAKDTVRLLVIARNTGPETVRLTRLRLIRPRGARFVKAKPDGYRSDILGLSDTLAPASSDPRVSRARKAIEALTKLTYPSDGKLYVVLAARFEFSTSIDKAGWVKAKAKVRCD
jgi:hypothetical protein